MVEPDDVQQQSRQSGLPEFVCVLPCTNPPIKYLDVLDGCSRGLHAFPHELPCLQVTLYPRMAAAIMAKWDPLLPRPTASPTPCSACRAPILLRATSPVYYMENCEHLFHDACLQDWRTERMNPSSQAACPVCSTLSSRVLMWPELFASVALKKEIFQLQKRSLGIDVSPQTVVKVALWAWHVENLAPSFQLTINSKYFSVSKRVPQAQPPKFKGRIDRKFNVSKPEPPAQENVEEGQNANQSKPASDARDEKRRVYLLRHTLCPFGAQTGHLAGTCQFWHNWLDGAPYKSSQTVPVVRHWPAFYCLTSPVVRPKDSKCKELIRVHPHELPRCASGFHPTVDEIASVDAFAVKMAKEIMAPVVPKADQVSLLCAFCAEPFESVHSVRLHLEVCGHCIHVECLPPARQLHSTNPNRKLELYCPACYKPSVRTIAWPAQFLPDTMRQALFKRQLTEFLLDVQVDTQVEIVEVANQTNVFTLNYGGLNVLSINTATASTPIHFD